MVQQDSTHLVGTGLEMKTPGGDIETLWPLLEVEAWGLEEHLKERGSSSPSHLWEGQREEGVQDNVHVCGCNGREVRRGGLRKEDQNGGFDIGVLGRNLGRALGKGALQTLQVEAGYGCNEGIHTGEAGMGRGCL